MMIINVILYLMGLLRTLFFVVLFYYLFRFLIRLLAPLFGYQQVKKQSAQRNRREERPDGDVRVEHSPQNQSHIRRDEGEYVDFEEIE